jgi:hypothetical protein
MKNQRGKEKEGKGEKEKRKKRSMRRWKNNQGYPKPHR